MDTWLSRAIEQETPTSKSMIKWWEHVTIHDPEDEQMLKETVQSALDQIEKKQYAAQLTARGIPKEHIRSYGFAFEIISCCSKIFTLTT